MNKTLLYAVVLLFSTVLTSCKREPLDIEGSGDFGIVKVGDHRDVKFTIVNTDTSSVSNLQVEPLPEGFSLLNSSCDSGLAAGSNCQLNVRLSPAGADEYTSELIVSYSNGFGFHTRAIQSIYGKGFTPPTDCYRGVYPYENWLYTDYQMHAWEGERTVLYAQQEFNQQDACLATSYMDACFELYQTLGQRDWPLITDSNFGAKGTLAMVPATCGAGCGYGGKAEMTVQSFLANGGDLTDPYSLWVGFYEFGRQNGYPFPFYEIFSHVPDRMNSAFPEYIWGTCLRKLGISDEEMASRGRWSPWNYRRYFQLTSNDYVQLLDQEGNQEVNGVAPGQVMAAVLYYLNWNFGDAFAKRLFTRAAELQARGEQIQDSYQAACSLFNVAEFAADGSQKEKVIDYLINEWRFPESCQSADISCRGNVTQMCELEHGEGYQDRQCVDNEWSQWSQCKVARCDSGYVRFDETCVDQAPFDLEQYCNREFGSNWNAELLGETAYDWVCTEASTGEQRGMDILGGCWRLYQANDTGFRDFYDPYSWYCD